MNAIRYPSSFFLLMACVVSPAYAATYTATILQPTGIDGSYAFGVAGGSQVGQGYGPSTGNNAHALLWSGTAASMVDLNPTGFNNSYAWGNSVTNQVGYGSGIGSGNNDHALLWSGTAASAIDLHPSGFTRSYAHGVFGTRQVGEGLTGAFTQRCYGTARRQAQSISIPQASRSHTRTAPRPQIR